MFRNGNQVVIGFSVPPRQRTSLWMKITGYQVIAGATNRWKYTWIEQRAAVGGRWEDVPGGLSNNTEHVGGFAYNSIEANNAAAGVQGNSVNISTLPSGFTIQPVSGNPVVRAWRETECPEVGSEEPGGKSSWHFSYENAVIGACP